MRLSTDSDDDSWPAASPIHPEHKSSSEDDLEQDLQRRAAQKRELLRRPEYDPPCLVAPGLWLGGVGAARDLQRLQALGVTHVVNASPIVPCFHRKALHYRAIAVFDDAEEDIAQFFHAACSYISKGIRKGGILVHCYAGQSRSSALCMAHLILEGLNVDEALVKVQAARPSALPNPGFMRQLRVFAAQQRQVGGLPQGR